MKPSPFLPFPPAALQPADLRPGKMALIVAPGAARPLLLALCGRLALNGPFTVLDAGNSFNALTVAQHVRANLDLSGTPGTLNTYLDRIQVARAFTCHQVASLLAQVNPSPGPVIVLDLLFTFQDESTPLWERLGLLKRCLRQLERLQQKGPLVVSARPPQDDQPGSRELFNLLANCSDQALAWAPPPSPTQLRLF